MAMKKLDNICSLFGFVMVIKNLDNIFLEHARRGSLPIPPNDPRHDSTPDHTSG